MEDDEDEDERRQRRKESRKRRHREREEEAGLDEDDFDLVAEANPELARSAPAEVHEDLQEVAHVTNYWTDHTRSHV